MQKIMFNDKYGLTKAVLEGKKTQTRRLIPEAALAKMPAFREWFYEQTLDLLEERDLLVQYFLVDEYGKTKYSVGETVAVAQSYQTIYEQIPKIDKIPAEEIPTMRLRGPLFSLSEKELRNKARSSKVAELLKMQDRTEIVLDKGKKTQIVSIERVNNRILDKINPLEISKEFNDGFCKEPGWKNKMFVKAELMPHHIRITSIRIERLQDISDEDCLKEGIIEDCPGVQYSFPTEIGYCGQYPFDTPKTAYAALIDKISGKGTWERNPWVFVYDYQLAK